MARKSARNRTHPSSAPTNNGHVKGGMNEGVRVVVSFPTTRRIPQSQSLLLSKLLRVPARLARLSALLIAPPLSHSLYFSTFVPCSLYSPALDTPLLRSILEMLPTRPFALGLDHLVIVPGHEFGPGRSRGTWRSKIRGYFIPERDAGIHPFSVAHISRTSAVRPPLPSTPIALFSSNQMSPTP